MSQAYEPEKILANLAPVCNTIPKDIDLLDIYLKNIITELKISNPILEDDVKV